ncbi:hypothetical protein Tco_1567959, partial [Tanacetum coccineum]
DKVQEESHLDVRPTLQRLPFYCTPPAATDVVIPDPTLEDLAVATPSFKILAKAEASQKRKASTSCATSSRVAKRTRVGSLLLPLLKVLVPEIPGERALWPMMLLHRPLVCRPRSSSGPAPSFRDVFEDAIHTDFFPFSVGPYYATYSEGGVVGNSEFTREEWDDPYRPTFEVLTKEVFKDLIVFKTMVDQFLIPG